jgi:hypothetical protein
MRITLIPQRGLPGQSTPAVTKAGDKLTIVSEEFDFSSLPEGADLPGEAVPCQWIHDGYPVTRIDGEIHLTMLLWHGPNPETWQIDPAPLIDVPDGPVDLPWDTWTEVAEEPAESGKNIITTIHRWHQDDEVSTVFVADPATEQEDADNGVDA